MADLIDTVFWCTLQFGLVIYGGRQALKLIDEWEDYEEWKEEQEWDD